MATNIYENVTEIVFQNNRFPLNGASVDDVLALLNVPDNAELAVEGTALLITEKSGTKGADPELIAQLAATVGGEAIKGASVKLVNGFQKSLVSLLMKLLTCLKKM